MPALVYELCIVVTRAECSVTFGMQPFLEHMLTAWQTPAFCRFQISLCHSWLDSQRINRG